MANFEAFIWEQENRIIKDFYNLPRQQREGNARRLFLSGWGKKEVKVLYSSEDDVLKAAVEYNSGLTKGLENELFIKEYKTKRRNRAECPTRSQGLLKAKLELLSLGARRWTLIKKKRKPCFGWVSLLPRLSRWR